MREQIKTFFPGPSGHLHVIGALALTLLPLITAPRQATAQDRCRTRCEANEMQDANGCCVRAPSARMTSDRPPDVASAPSKRAREAVLFQAYHLSGELSQERERDDLIAALVALKGDDSLEALEERSALAWAILLSMDQEVLQLDQACMQSSHSATEYSECAKNLEGARSQRVAFLKLALPTWKALIEQSPDAPWRTQTRYYLGVATLLSGEEVAGVEILSELLSGASDDDPYKLFTALALADHLQVKGKFTQARALYLKAQLQNRSPGVKAYGAYMEGWCLASEGDLEGAMRAMLLGFKRARSHSWIQSRKSLTTAISTDITLLYAYAGQPANALQFYEALGVPGALLPVELMRLARRYEMLGKTEEAKLLYRALAGSSTEARERLEVMEEKKAP